jgi:hypothetical protein
MSSAIRAFAFVTAVAVIAPASAHAQLGGFIKRKVAEKTAEKVVDKATGQSSNSGSIEGNVEFNAELIEITPAVLDRFSVAYKADKAERAKMMELKKKEADLAAARDSKEACKEKQQKEQEKKSEGAQTDAQRLSLAMQSAALKGDAKLMAALQDSLLKLQSGLIVDNKCGSSQDDEDALNQLQNAESEIEKAGALAGKFSFRQYSILRERVAAYVVAKGKPVGQRYTKNELASLDAKMGELTVLLGDDFRAGGVPKNRITAP